MVAYNAFDICSHGGRREKDPWKLFQFWKSRSSQIAYLCWNASVQSLLDQHTREMTKWTELLQSRGLQGAHARCAATSVWVQHQADTTSLHPPWPGQRVSLLPSPAPLNKPQKGMYKSCGRDNKNWRSQSRCRALEYHLGLSNSSQNSLLRNCSGGWDGIVTQGQAGRKESRSSGSSLQSATGASKIVAMLLITR